MRHGRVFRSDSLASLSDADIRYVVATLGLRFEHGSVEGYLEGHGLAPDVVGSLRAGLLA